ncbi:hypothetical protein GQ42DRAFT_9789 [Ramicandelaber brevisporus]|nr:hypothetical protein GQ42DRAFT_9789 [Ramicandelaber brevisporus]
MPASPVIDDPISPTQPGGSSRAAQMRQAGATGSTGMLETCPQHMGGYTTPPPPQEPDVQMSTLAPPPS